MYGRKEKNQASPVKSASKDQQIISTEVFEATFVKCAIEDEAPSLVDDDELKDSPSTSQRYGPTNASEDI